MPQFTDLQMRVPRAAKYQGNQPAGLDIYTGFHPLHNHGRRHGGAESEQCGRSATLTSESGD